MKNIIGFENYVIQQDGLITNSNTKKSLKEIKPGIIRLSKDGTRFVFNIADLILDNYNKIVLKEYLSINPDLDFFVDDYIIEDRIVYKYYLNDFTSCDGVPGEFIKLTKPSTETLILYKENFPDEHLRYLQEKRKLIVDEIDFKTIVEYPELAISKDCKIYAISNSRELKETRGKIKHRVGDRVIFLKPIVFYQKYFG